MDYRPITLSIHSPSGALLLRQRLLLPGVPRDRVAPYPPAEVQAMCDCMRELLSNALQTAFEGNTGVLKAKVLRDLVRDVWAGMVALLAGGVGVGWLLAMLGVLPT